jgi:transcriptional regulator with XRE-family HTH domain
MRRAILTPPSKVGGRKDGLRGALGAPGALAVERSDERCQSDQQQLDATSHPHTSSPQDVSPRVHERINAACQMLSRSSDRALTRVRLGSDDPEQVFVSSSEEHRDESVGVRLRRLRLERGLSQRELSGPGVSYAYISRIEAGERRPSVKALRVLAAKLGLSAEYLETGRDMRADEERELRLADAELEIRLADDPTDAAAKLETVLEEALAAGDAASASRARTSTGR